MEKHETYYKGWIKKHSQNDTKSGHDCSTNIDHGAKMIKQGQNNISRALIWDKVRLCRPNMTRDMIKNVKTVIFKKCSILHFLA